MFRRFLSLLLIVALLIGDVAAVRHLGNCCGSARWEGAAADLASASVNSNRTTSVATPADAAAVAGVEYRRCCGHAGCSRPGRPTAGTATEIERRHSQPDEPHDSDTCALCRWLAAARSACTVPVVSLGLTLPVDNRDGFGVCAFEPSPLFLPTLSRRGPPLPLQRLA